MELLLSAFEHHLGLLCAFTLSSCYLVEPFLDAFLILHALGFIVIVRSSSMISLADSLWVLEANTALEHDSSLFGFTVPCSQGLELLVCCYKLVLGVDTSFNDDCSLWWFTFLRGLEYFGASKRSGCFRQWMFIPRIVSVFHDARRHGGSFSHLRLRIQYPWCEGAPRSAELALVVSSGIEWRS
ncbi:hypothetical protein DL93DRAFT_762777 [Clavulina sp. PMI_390]|nr:hypothetical protein DL93DRAFT_762777 [Clavulina sp. PMI_390]